MKISKKSQKMLKMYPFQASLKRRKSIVLVKVSDSGVVSINETLFKCIEIQSRNTNGSRRLHLTRILL